jgi:hypothetical protein
MCVYVCVCVPGYAHEDQPSAESRAPRSVTCSDIFVVRFYELEAKYPEILVRTER